ncbi:class I SAM-dependent methyltransferase, partial [Candidatus Parcubacteria bacterium]|nr:class I SAM-dependent methyltransferase [Candidatus Parcubacteria bacterium]
DAIWANNLFEHLLSPHHFLMELRKHAHKDTLLILGVPVVPWAPFLMRLKKFRGSLASNHINFFTAKTLQLTVARAGWKVLSARSFFIDNALLDTFATGLAAPHVYVVAKNNIDFTYPEKKVREWEDDEHYADLLRATKQKA